MTKKATNSKKLVGADSSQSEVSNETQTATHHDTSNVEISRIMTSVSQESGEECGCKELELELELVEVDMNHHLMDPLEWTVRKTISIPKMYYWETGNYDISFRTKVWHRSVQSMGMTLRGG